MREPLLSSSATHDLRGLRAVAAGLVCGVGAVLAHAGAAGHDVATVPALLLTGLGLAAGPVLVRRCTTGRLVLGAAAVQVAGHALLGLAPPRSGPGHGAHAAGHTATASLLEGGVRMLVGHLLVATLTGLLAVRADRALVALARAGLDRLRTLPTATPTPVAPTRPRRVAVVGGPPRPLSHPAPTGPRGPPRSGTSLTHPA